MKKIFLLFLIVVICAGAAIFFGYQKKSENLLIPKNLNFIKGITFSPKNFSANDITDFYNLSKQAGQAVSWAGDWNELANLQNGGPAVIASLAKKYGYIPVIEAQFFNQSDGRLVKPLNEENKQNYKKFAADFAEKFKPKYFGLGIEVNILYEKSPYDFNDFVEFFSEVYDAIKAKSPQTKVFIIFQLEKMKGLNGGLFGGTNNPAKSEWSLLEKFPQSDIIAFTTYPDLIYKNPSEIPTDYYTEIKTHTTKPIAFTEVGWHSSNSPKGWESNEAAQAGFISNFFALAKNLNKELVIWSFLYDQKTFEPFNSMGLRRADGAAKAAWNEWIKIK